MDIFERNPVTPVAADHQHKVQGRNWREVQGDAGDAHGLVLSINLAVLYPRGGQQEGIINLEQRCVVQESEELLESVGVQRPCLACFERNGMSSLLEDLMQVAIAQE